MLRLSDHLQSTHQVGTDTESGTATGIHSHRRNEHIQDAESGSSSEGDNDYLLHVKLLLGDGKSGQSND